jgi:hypothetical protein
MFKKRFKVSNSHPISNKDRKALKDLLLKLEFEPDYINHFLTDKNFEAEFENEEDCQICMDKITGQRVVLYSRGSTPFLFTAD